MGVRGGSAVGDLGRPVGGPEAILGDMLAIDSFAVFFKLLVLVAGALTILLATGFLDRFKYGGGEVPGEARRPYLGGPDKKVDNGR